MSTVGWLVTLIENASSSQMLLSPIRNRPRATAAATPRKGVSVSNQREPSTTRCCAGRREPSRAGCSSAEVVALCTAEVSTRHGGKVLPCRSPVISELAPEKADEAATATLWPLAGTPEFDRVDATWRKATLT